MLLPKPGDLVVRKRANLNNWPFGLNAVRVFKCYNADEFEVVGDIRSWDRLYFDPYPSAASTPQTALSLQIGGDHYKSLAIQPIEYITKNNLGWCEGNIVKYITRWKQKGGSADIDKVIHYAQLLKELNEQTS